MKTAAITPERENQAPYDVKISDYGCKNCLYASIECKQGSPYKPHKAFNGLPSCEAYVYYD